MTATLDADAGAITGSVLGVDVLVWVVAALVTVALGLFAYVFRIATVANRTLAIGPFILRNTDGSARIDRDGS